MKTRALFSISSTLILLLVLCSAGGIGCARTARDTTGFAVTDKTIVKQSDANAWQTTKAVLREKGYEIYTRDKRGVFVAYTGKSTHLLQYHRMKFTIALEPVSDSETEISIESLRQVYGVTLLTYPGWHDRKTTDHSQAQDILKSIETKASGS
jgi:hypothetical protein